MKYGNKENPPLLIKTTSETPLSLLALGCRKGGRLLASFSSFVVAPDLLLSRLESPASCASSRVKTSLKTRADFRASNGQIGTGISEFHVLLPKFEAAGALFAVIEVICDATQEGQRKFL